MIKKKHHDDATMEKQSRARSSGAIIIIHLPGMKRTRVAILTAAGLPSVALSADPRQMTRALKDRARNRVAWRRQTDIRRSACLSGKTIAPRRVESLSERSRARRG